jgi:hypothetical protein
MSNPNNATVQSAVARGTKEAEALKIWGVVCDAGAQCAEVQASPVATGALADLKTAVGNAGGSLAVRISAGLTLDAAIKTLRADYGLLGSAVRTYLAAVAGVAKGNAAIINKAGLKAHIRSTTPVPLDKVSVVHTQVGKHSMESILTWPPGPGATGYAIEVNVTPSNPAGPWTALTSGTGRRRIVKGPTPGCQILARVASLGTGGEQSDWSDPVLCTTAF